MHLNWFIIICYLWLYNFVQYIGLTYIVRCSIILHCGVVIKKLITKFNKSNTQTSCCLRICIANRMEQFYINCNTNNLIRVSCFSKIKWWNRLLCPMSLTQGPHAHPNYYLAIVNIYINVCLPSLTTGRQNNHEFWPLPENEWSMEWSFLQI